MAKECSCGDWKEWIPKIDGPLILDQIRSGKQRYIKPFCFCPWCGNTLVEEHNENKK